VTTLTVDPTALDEFQRDGATVLRGVVSDEQLSLLADGVERNLAHPSPNAHWYTDPSNAVGFWSDYVTWRSVPEYERIVRDGGLARAAAALMGSRTARFFHEHVLVKEAGATERTPWHHDQPYYCVDGDQNVSMWLALDPVPETSALRFIAGSHRWNRWFIPRRFIDHAPYGMEDDRYEQLPDRFVGSDGELEGERVITLPVEPGDVVCFHFRTLHGAPGNPNAAARRAVSLRWVGDDAVWAERPWPVSPPFEGEGLDIGDPLDDERFPVIHP